MPRYVVDGYNVIHQSPALSRGSLRDRRERLLRFIEERRPQGGAESVTVVFDGRTDVSSPRWGGPTRVLFSPGQDADRMIKSLVDELSNPREAVVVTDDQAIRRWVRAAGARVLDTRSFLAAGRPARAAGSPAPAEDETVNEELRRLWNVR